MVLDDLLANLFDYAGLFPPAGLGMDAAVRNFAAYRRSGHAAWLGRFIVPAARLREFEASAAAVSPEGWRLSALGGADLSADLAEIARFNAAHATETLCIDAIEFRADTIDEIHAKLALAPASLTPYVEIPIQEDPAALIGTLAERGARAKVRTGGVTPAAFPPSLNLARFIAQCSDEDVPFKATAGLHHPVRGVHRLTDAPDSESAMMHGFLNLLLTAAFAQNGLGIEQLAEVLEERAPDAFGFDQGSITWRGEMAVRAHIRNMRSLLVVSFGSCSFTEPIEDLKTMGLL